ncbi:MAG: hypothetical protein KKH11_01020, partial [Candidatus Omnitrophica bacterium]|nr:hypothetical protein [Candidatus Omnitrophota bacterium]
MKNFIEQAFEFINKICVDEQASDEYNERRDIEYTDEFAEKLDAFTYWRVKEAERIKNELEKNFNASSPVKGARPVHLTRRQKKSSSPFKISRGILLKRKKIESALYYFIRRTRYGDISRFTIVNADCAVTIDGIGIMVYQWPKIDGINVIEQTAYCLCRSWDELYAGLLNAPKVNNIDITKNFDFSFSSSSSPVERTGRMLAILPIHNSEVIERKKKAQKQFGFSANDVRNYIFYKENEEFILKALKKELTDNEDLGIKRINILDAQELGAYFSTYVKDLFVFAKRIVREAAIKTDLILIITPADIHESIGEDNKIISGAAKAEDRIAAFSTYRMQGAQLLSVFSQKINVNGLHEIGHLFGLKHCRNHCIMSRTVNYFIYKEFCHSCRNKLAARNNSFALSSSPLGPAPAASAIINTEYLHLRGASVFCIRKQSSSPTVRNKRENRNRVVNVLSRFIASNMNRRFIFVIDGYTGVGKTLFTKRLRKSLVKEFAVSRKNICIIEGDKLNKTYLLDIHRRYSYHPELKKAIERAFRNKRKIVIYEALKAGEVFRKIQNDFSDSVEVFRITIKNEIEISYISGVLNNEAYVSRLRKNARRIAIERWGLEEEWEIEYYIKLYLDTHLGSDRTQGKARSSSSVENTRKKGEGIRMKFNTDPSAASPIAVQVSELFATQSNYSSLAELLAKELFGKKHEDISTFTEKANLDIKVSNFGRLASISKPESGFARPISDHIFIKQVSKVPKFILDEITFIRTMEKKRIPLTVADYWVGGDRILRPIIALFDISEEYLPRCSKSYFVEFTLSNKLKALIDKGYIRPEELPKQLLKQINSFAVREKELKPTYQMFVRLLEAGILHEIAHMVWFIISLKSEYPNQWQDIISGLNKEFIYALRQLESYFSAAEPLFGSSSNVEHFCDKLTMFWDRDSIYYDLGGLLSAEEQAYFSSLIEFLETKHKSGENIFFFGDPQGSAASPIKKNQGNKKDKALPLIPKELSSLLLPDLSTKAIKKKGKEITTALKFGKKMDLEFDEDAGDEEIRATWPAHRSFDKSILREGNIENWPYVIINGHKVSFCNFDKKSENYRDYYNKPISIDLNSKTFDLNDTLRGLIREDILMESNLHNIAFNPVNNNIAFLPQYTYITNDPYEVFGLKTRLYIIVELDVLNNLVKVALTQGSDLEKGRYAEDFDIDSKGNYFILEETYHLSPKVRVFNQKGKCICELNISQKFHWGDFAVKDNMVYLKNWRCDKERSIRIMQIRYLGSASSSPSVKKVLKMVPSVTIDGTLIGVMKDCKGETFLVRESPLPHGIFYKVMKIELGVFEPKEKLIGTNLFRIYQNHFKMSLISIPRKVYQNRGIGSCLMYCALRKALVHLVEECRIYSPVKPLRESLFHYFGFTKDGIEDSKYYFLNDSLSIETLKAAFRERKDKQGFEFIYLDLTDSSSPVEDVSHSLRKIINLALKGDEEAKGILLSRKFVDYKTERPIDFRSWLEWIVRMGHTGTLLGILDMTEEQRREIELLMNEYVESPYYVSSPIGKDTNRALDDIRRLSFLAEIGSACLDLGNYLKAGEVFKYILSEEPGNARALSGFNKAMRCLSVGDSALAVKIQFPGGLNPVYEFALESLEQGRNQEVIDRLVAIPWAKGDAAILTILGYAYARLEDFHSAFKSFQEGLRINPEDELLNKGYEAVSVFLRARIGSIGALVLKNK